MNRKIISHGESADVIVIGGGHAGCEAALAAARIGARTLMLLMSIDNVAMMPCNPSIGGTSKGHLVREVDAMGGEMGKNIDKTFVQSRMLNTSKGPAVHSLRAQADKARYSAEMRRTLENTPNLHLRQAEAMELICEDGKVIGVVTEAGTFHACRAVIVCTGTYLNARCLYGETIIESGPNGLRNSSALSDSLRNLGVEMLRFKTGTPARIAKDSIDFSKMEAQHGDDPIVPFSFSNPPGSLWREQLPCWLTYTNAATHEIIRANLHRSPMYAGVIEGTGTRYCPSIEDKIVRFADKDRHQIFIEPEGESTNEMYVQGMSTSLPEDVQIAMYRTLPGLENCRFVRNGYAIEYDVLDATQLRPTLEFKRISGLYGAGQINGSSGYEEAAAQGIVAGINAAGKALGILPDAGFIVDRSEGYVGVLIDDLVIKGSKEPYRMMTSRAEYRLLLRQDNADLRLTEKAYHAKSIPQKDFDKFISKRNSIDMEIARVQATTVAPNDNVNQLLEKYGSTPLKTGAKLDELIRRPELDYEKLAGIDPRRPVLDAAVCEQVNIAIKYEGYINNQLHQADQFRKLESKALPQDIDYEAISNLRLEARQKLNALRPANIGQASRITGVSPADIAILMVYLKI